jgi:hypothetical protein
MDVLPANNAGKSQGKQAQQKKILLLSVKQKRSKSLIAS